MRKLDAHGSLLEALSSDVFKIPVLQLCAIDEPLFPNIITLYLWSVAQKAITFIPLFLSPRTAVVHISFTEVALGKARVASLISTSPTLCPNVEGIYLLVRPKDPVITAAVSKMLLAGSRNVLRSLRVDSPLTEETRRVVYNLPDLRTLSVVIGGDAPSPVVLPNFARLTVNYTYDSDCLRMFHGATIEDWSPSPSSPDPNQLATSLKHSKRLHPPHPPRIHSQSSISTPHAHGPFLSPSIHTTDGTCHSILLWCWRGLLLKDG